MSMSEAEDNIKMQ